jgi:hypothetical protein
MPRHQLTELRKAFYDMATAGEPYDQIVKKLRIARASAFRWRIEMGVPKRKRGRRGPYKTKKAGK